MELLNFESKRDKFLSTINIISCVTIILIFIQTFRKAYRPIGYDLSCYLISSKDFFNGKNPYTIDSIFPFIYPQFFDVLMYPFTLIPYWAAVFLWIIIGYISLFYSIKIVLDTLTKKQTKTKEIFLYFSIINLLLFAILQDNFLNGQVNMLLIFICLLFFKFFLEKKFLISSLFLAVAISIKLTPAILLFFILFQKKYQIFLLTSASSILFIIGIPYFITGDKSLEYYHYYLENFILHKTTSRNDIEGFALSTFLSYINPKIAVILSFMIMLTLNFINQKKSIIENCDVKLLLIFSLYLLSILFISPMSEGHHLILILPSYLIILKLITEIQNKTIIGIFIFLTITLLAFKRINILVFFNITVLYILLTKLNFSGYFNKITTYKHLK